MTMRFLHLMLAFLFLILSVLPVVAAPTTDGYSPDYIIGTGDVLDISVWQNEALSRQLVVLPDGKITFPLIGEVKAGDKTVAELKKELEDRLQQYVPDPILSVIVQQVNSMLVYVVGKVNNPGRFALNTNVNVLQALTMAGGLNPYAKKDKIKIFRNGAGQTNIFRFKYDEVTDGENLGQNILLRRGDVVVVP